VAAGTGAMVASMPAHETGQKNYPPGKNYPTLKFMLPAAAATTRVPYGFSLIKPDHI